MTNGITVPIRLYIDDDLSLWRTGLLKYYTPLPIRNMKDYTLGELSVEAVGTMPSSYSMGTGFPNAFQQSVNLE